MSDQEYKPTQEELDAAEDAGAKVLILSRGVSEDGRDLYVYLAISPSRIEEFNHAEQEGGFKYSDFGEVLASGFQKDPPQDVMKEMEEKYGFDHNLQQVIIEKAEELHKKDTLLKKYTGKRKRDK